MYDEYLIKIIDDFKQNFDEYNEKLIHNKMKLSKVKNYKRLVILFIILSILVKFPKFYSYDFLLNFISLIINNILLLILDIKEGNLKLEQNLLNVCKDNNTELSLKITKELIKIRNGIK